MSITFPRGINKSDLQGLYEEVGATGDFASKKMAELKSDIETAITSNKNALVSRASNSENLSYILDRLAPSAKSPTKRQSAPEKLQESVTSEDEPAPKKGRRKTVAQTVEETSSSALDMIKTPAKDLIDAIVPRRSSILASPTANTSPGAVVDYVERQTRAVSGYVTQSVERTHLSEYSNLLRSTLSSPLAVNGLIVAVEFYALSSALIEWRNAFGLPIPGLGKVVAVKGPDLFALVTPGFWAPFSLWLLTTIVAPTLVAYFINYPVRNATSHSHGTRRATAQQDAAPNVDPVVFNIAKALISYLIYASSGPTGVWPYKIATIQSVDQALYFGYPGLITTSLIGATFALYEAVLRK